MVTSICLLKYYQYINFTAWYPYVCLFNCLGFYVKLKNFSLIWRYHHYRFRLQILTHAQHSWPLSSEGSLARHTHCDTGHPFIMVISDNPWLSHLLQSVWQWSCHNLFLRLRSIMAGIWTPNFPHESQTLLPTAQIMVVVSIST